MAALCWVTMKFIAAWKQPLYEKNNLKMVREEKKLQLIESMNPEWLDLYYQLI
jgi:predicted GIY-YIG superfamily endonuclease